MNKWQKLTLLFLGANITLMPVPSLAEDCQGNKEAAGPG